MSMRILRSSKDNFLRNRFNHLLVVVLSLFLIAPFMQSEEDIAFLPIIPFIYTAAVIAVLGTIITNKKQFYLLAGLKIATFALDMLVYYEVIHVFEQTIHLLDLAIRNAFFLLFLVHLIKEVFTTKQVTGDTIKGGICIYIFLGILWAGFYRLTYEIYPASFSAPLTEYISFFYFSFTTLTTVGYGDITPASGFARMLTTLEGMAGPLYLAVFLARLVGMHLAQKRN